MANDVTTAASPKRSRDWPARAGIAVVVVLCLGVVGLLVSEIVKRLAYDGGLADAERTHAAFELALEEERLADAYAMTTPRFQRETSFDDFNDLIERNPAAKGRRGSHWTKKEKLLRQQSGSHEFMFQTGVYSERQSAAYQYVVITTGRGHAKVDSLLFQVRRTDVAQ